MFFQANREDKKQHYENSERTIFKCAAKQKADWIEKMTNTNRKYKCMCIKLIVPH